MPLRLIQGELFPIKKACITCNVEKPLDEFYADRGTSGGKKNECITCTNYRTGSLYRKIRGKAAITREEFDELQREKLRLKSLNSKICRTCNIEKPRSEFYIKRMQKTRFREAYESLEYQCKSCQTIRVTAWREENPLDPERVRENSRKWSAANRGKMNAKNAKRKALKLQRTPKWLTKEQCKQMADMYTKAQWLTKQTGVKYHVDHIIPLRGKNVSGLHVPWNLQVITATENCGKGIKFDGMNIPCLGISIPINSKKVKVMQ